MPDSLHLYCACGGEMIGENLTTEVYDELMKTWSKDHDRPGCYAVSAREARRARRRNLLKGE